MKRVRRRITAAEEIDNGLSEAIKDLEDDFSYLISGIEKLSRSGANKSNEGLALVETISASIQSFISQVADAVTTRGGDE